MALQYSKKLEVGPLGLTKSSGTVLWLLYVCPFLDCPLAFFQRSPGLQLSLEDGLLALSPLRQSMMAQSIPSMLNMSEFYPVCYYIWGLALWAYFGFVRVVVSPFYQTGAIESKLLLRLSYSNQDESELSAEWYYCLTPLSEEDSSALIALISLGVKTLLNSSRPCLSSSSFFFSFANFLSFFSFANSTGYFLLNSPIQLQYRSLACRALTQQGSFSSRLMLFHSSATNLATLEPTDSPFCWARVCPFSLQNTKKLDTGCLGLCTFTLSSFSFSVFCAWYCYILSPVCSAIYFLLSSILLLIYAILWLSTYGCQCSFSADFSDAYCIFCSMLARQDFRTSSYWYIFLQLQPQHASIQSMAMVRQFLAVLQQRLTVLAGGIGPLGCSLAGLCSMVLWYYCGYNGQLLMVNCYWWVGRSGHYIEI